VGSSETFWQYDAYQRERTLNPNLFEVGDRLADDYRKVIGAVHPLER
jgi:hypothetical protein